MNFLEVAGLVFISLIVILGGYTAWLGYQMRKEEKAGSLSDDPEYNEGEQS